MSKAQIVSVFLFGSQFSPKQNNDLFFHIQSFRSESFLHVLDKGPNLERAIIITLYHTAM